MLNGGTTFSSHDDAKAHFNLGVAYNKLGKYEDAIKSYKHAIRINPDYANAHYNLDVAYDKLGMYEESIEALP